MRLRSPQLNHGKRLGVSAPQCWRRVQWRTRKDGPTFLSIQKRERNFEDPDSLHAMMEAAKEYGRP